MARRKTRDPSKSEGSNGSTRLGRLFEMLRHSTPRPEYQRWITWVAFALVLCVGLFVRLEDLGDWDDYQYFYQGQAGLTTTDGYYYLALARDLVEGTYDPVDEKRAVPDSPLRPQPPPLLSVSAATIAMLTSFPVIWVAAVLPAFLGILLGIPLFLLGRFYAGPVMGVTAALVGLLSYYYVYRSSFGWFDTDCMVVTWGLSATYLFLRFGVEQGRRRYGFLAGGLLVYALFLWWYDQSPQVATVISLSPLAIAVVFFYRPSRREGLAFAGCAAAVLAGVFLWQGEALFAEFLDRLLGTYAYISKESSGIFPNVGVSVSEQKGLTLRAIVGATTDSRVTLVLAGVGLLLLFVRKPKESLFLWLPLVLGLLSFLFAMRFLIFVAPISALGLGYLVAVLWRFRERSALFAVIAPLLLVYLTVPALQKDLRKTFQPKEPPILVEGMDYASRSTEENAVIWAWWDHGYPMRYWSRRATINDGSVHTGERTVYNAIPYATSDFRLAANFMQFYVKHGVAGMHAVYAAVGDEARGLALVKAALAGGPARARELVDATGLAAVGNQRTTDDWLEFLFPGQVRPIYLFVDGRMVETAYWWYWFGSWDLETRDGTHPHYMLDFDITLEGSIVRTRSGRAVDLEKGVLYAGNQAIGLKSAFVQYGDRQERYDYERDDGLLYEVHVPGRFSALQDDAISTSVFNSLFIRQADPRGYFRLVRSRMPGYQLWRVEGDTLQARSRQPHTGE